MESIILEPVSSGIYDNTNLEPQFIQSRTINKANIHILASDAIFETNRTDILISSIKNKNDQPQNLGRGIKRITVGNIGMSWVTPNINERNNTLRFRSSISSSFHTITLQEGFYDDRTVLMNEIINKMNSVGSGQVYTFTQIPLSGGYRFQINCIPGLFYFDNNCSALLKGSNVYGFQKESLTPIGQSSKSVGPMFLCYTRYVDFCSTRLNAYSKMQDTTTGYSSNIIYRAGFDLNNAILKPGFLNVIVASETAKNFLYDDSLTLIDFQVRDEFGELLYVPSYNQNFDWGIRLVVEC